jgi:type II secretory ATPase GspE/PulE/Tfp pilus assembly ATPase PilB-like protein
MHSDHLSIPGGDAQAQADAGGNLFSSGVEQNVLDPQRAIVADGETSALVSMEGIAVQYDLLPVDLPRASCNVEAENLVRKLGRWPLTENPWLPVTSMGPFVVLAHYNPKETELWGVPDFFCVKIVISAVQYEDIRREIVQRVSHNPLRKENPLEQLQKPTFEPRDLKGVFDWFMDSYPLEETERERLARTYKEALAKDDEMTVARFNALRPSLGSALYSLASPRPVLSYNPDDAPRQDKFPNMLLEKHGVYPVFIGRHRVYLLSEQEDNYAFEDEWLSSGNDPVEMVTVMADGKAIGKAIGRNNDIGLDVEGATMADDDYSFSSSTNIVEIIPEDVYAIDPRNPNHTPEEIIHWVLYQSINAGASDIHLEKYYNTARFRARLDGGLKTIYTASEELLPRLIALFKNYANMSQTRQETQDGRFGIAIGKRRVDVRAAAVPCRKEMQKLIMRFLDKQDGLKELSELNLTRRQSDLFGNVMSRDQGLVLVTGPTGSGKTTTLYALLNSINEEDINIHTIEDPIEYEVEGINQTQTDMVHGIDFLTGLRSLLRADPDVILIGESRDEETANAAVNAALTGHLVLTTLHANDCLRAISRLLSMGVPAYLMCDSLALTQAQRLVRRLCPYCKRPVEAGEALQETLQKQGVIDKPLTAPIYERVGCRECHSTGYRGRLALMELCEITTEMGDLIEGGAMQAQLRKVARRNGMATLYQEGLKNILSGNTTFEEIRGLAYTAE